jgi:uncharacterized protein
LDCLYPSVPEAAMESRFEEVITTRQRLRELNRGPHRLVRNKTIDHIDDICRRFIAACPFVLVASRGGDDQLDLSPKGDPAGFVTVLDNKTLAIPDRLGNNRLTRLRICSFIRTSDYFSLFQGMAIRCE